MTTLTTNFKEITADEIISSKKKYDTILKIDEKAKVKKYESFGVYYIAILFKRLDGTYSKLKFSFTNQILGSGAKEGFNKKDFKYFTVAFRKFTLEEIKQNSLISPTKVDDYYSNSEKNVLAMRIINNEFKKLVETQILNKKKINGKKIKITNNKIIEFEQNTFFNKDTEEYSELENPLYRIKLYVNNETGEVTNYKGNPYVYSLRTASRLNNYIPEPAKKNGKLLNRDTAPDIITFGSLSVGTLNFNNIVISKQGISLDNKITQLLIVHKQRTITNKFNKESIMNMNELSESDSDDESEPDEE